MENMHYSYGKKSFSSAAYGFGIAALIASIVLAIFPIAGLGLGAMGLTMALISRGYDSSFDKKANSGFVLSLIAIGIALLILCISVFVVFYTVDYATLLSEMDSMLGDYYNEYFGYTPSDLFKALFGEGGLINA